MSATISQLVTADELLTMPHNGFRYELVRGELKQKSPSGSEHGVTVVHLTWPLAQHVKDNHLGIVFGAETGFKITTNPDTVRAPDIAFVSHERIPATGIPRGFWPGAPDLAVEVVSPGDTIYGINILDAHEVLNGLKSDLRSLNPALFSTVSSR